MCSLLHKVIHDINAFNQLRTMVMGQPLGSRVACNMHRFLVKLSVKKFSYLLPVQYNITFSVQFFCPRAISKLGDKTHPPGHIFLIIIFVLDIPAVFWNIPITWNFRLGTNLKGAKNWKSTGIISIPIPFLRTSFPSPSNPNPIFPA